MLSCRNCGKTESHNETFIGRVRNSRGSSASIYFIDSMQAHLTPSAVRHNMIRCGVHLAPPVPLHQGSQDRLPLDTGSGELFICRHFEV